MTTKVRSKKEIFVVILFVCFVLSSLGFQTYRVFSSINEIFCKWLENIVTSFLTIH